MNEIHVYLYSRKKSLSKDQLYYHQAIMSFKCMTSHTPEYLTSRFITHEHVSERTTWSSQKLNISLFRTASRLRTFYCRTVKLLWNNLEPFLKLTQSLQIFKRSLRIESAFRQCCKYFVVKFKNIVISIKLSTVISYYK